TCEKQKDVESFAPIALVREPVTLASERDPDTGDPVMSCVVRVATGAQVTRLRIDACGRRSSSCASTHSAATELAEHLGNRKAGTLREIDEWVSLGELRFQPRRQRSPLGSLKAEQVADPAA